MDLQPGKCIVLAKVLLASSNQNVEEFGDSNITPSLVRTPPPWKLK